MFPENGALFDSFTVDKIVPKFICCNIHYEPLLVETFFYVTVDFNPEKYFVSNPNLVE